MPRIISWPKRIGVTSIAPASGPAARNSGVNASVNGFEQTSSTLGDLVTFNLTLAPNQGVGMREFRGRVTALLSGANAIRFPLIDPDRRAAVNAGQPWSTGATWSNGQTWAPDSPLVPVVVGGTAGSTEVRFEATHWGRSLDFGDWVGFGPSYFGAHMVIGKQFNGNLILWPALRSDITTNHYGTLRPTLLMRTYPGGFATQRGASTEGQSLSLVEVPDNYKTAFVDL